MSNPLSLRSLGSFLRGTITRLAPTPGNLVGATLIGPNLASTLQRAPPLPLVARGWEWGSGDVAPLCPHGTTPRRIPPPQGGREPRAARSPLGLLLIRATLVIAPSKIMTLLICIALMALVFASPALAEKGKLRERLTPEVMAVVYPAGADRLGPEEGSPPAIAVYKGDKVAAYVFSTLDIIAAPGYSTTPFDVIAGVDLEGRITGAKVVFHNEPYIVHDPKRQRLLDTFLAREAGRPLRGGTNLLPPDFVAGATISTRAMRAAVSITAGLVLRPRLARPSAAVATPGGAVPAPAAPTLDVESFSRKSWDALVATGAVVRRRVTSGEVAEALAAAGAPGAQLDVPLSSRSDSLYIEFVTALFTPAAIGGNLVGMLNFEDFKRKMPSDAQAIFVASNGPYNFLGTKYFQEGRFDRIRVVQDGRTFSFAQDDYQWVNPFGEGIKGQEDAALFALPASSGFDPLKPWRLELLVNGTVVAAGAPPVTVAFGLDYNVPDLDALAKPDDQRDRRDQPVVADQAAQTGAGDANASDFQLPLDLEAPVPAWVEAWHDARANVAILSVLLTVLTLIFVFQAQLARSRLAHRLVRNGFLLVVLVWLGWTAGVQLSIVNVMNYLMAPFNRFDIGFYLAEPLMVIIAGYTLLSMVLIGRGVFCGWLCPFGALQELLAQLSRALRVPQWNPPAALEQRLWLGKYIAAAAVLVLVMTQIDPSGATLEIEPFKTAITSKFTRAWPYVLYAGALLAVGLFSERAYCRFLCPLGGVLAFLDRLHLLNLLKRRPECGNPCHLCERSCPVRAIEPTGKIVTAECFQCLDCQVEYYDDKRCPPLVQAAKRRVSTRPAAASAEA
jgi:NosR/NirI family transcriptional regulator, nitrous oxide reductase regulator